LLVRLQADRHLIERAREPLVRPARDVADTRGVVAAGDAIGRIHQRADRPSAPPQPAGGDDQSDDDERGHRDGDERLRVRAARERRDDARKGGDQNHHHDEHADHAATESPTGVGPTAADPRRRS